MTRGYLLEILTLSLAVAMILPGVVSADPCTAMLGFPIIPAVYANSIVTVIVPVSATCSASYGNQLNATGNAYDLTSDTSTGSVNTILTSVNGGYTFTGQLGFNLPPSTQGHWVQITVTIYSAQDDGKLTTTGEAFPVNNGTVHAVTTVTQQFAPSPQGTEPQPFIFVYVAIAAILATVIIVTVGLIVYSRRQPRYYPVQPQY